MKIEIINSKKLNFFIIINSIALLSSCIMYLIFQIDEKYPKTDWNYLGHHDNLTLDFLISSLYYVSLIIIVCLVVSNNVFDKILVKNKPKRIKLKNVDKFYIYLIIIYGFLLYAARYFGVDVLNRKETLSGFERELIYYLYRTIIPFTIVFIYPIASLKIRRYIIYLIPIYSWISDSRIPILMTSLLVFLDIYLNDIRIIKIFKLFMFSVYIISLLHIFSNHRGLITIQDSKKSFIENEYSAINKNYEQTFIKQDSLIVIRDLITTPLSRISSHIDFLLVDDWRIEDQKIGYVVLNRFFGITLRKYNFSEEMKNLYKFDPGPGKMAAPGPTGIALALFKASLLGQIIVILFLSSVVLLINYIVDSLISYFEYLYANEQLIKSIIYIQWLWISPRSAMVGLIYISLIIFIIKYRYNKIK